MHYSIDVLFTSFIFLLVSYISFVPLCLINVFHFFGILSDVHIKVGHYFVSIFLLTVYGNIKRRVKHKIFFNVFLFVSKNDKEKTNFPFHFTFFWQENNEQSSLHCVSINSMFTCIKSRHIKRQSYLLSLNTLLCNLKRHPQMWICIIDIVVSFSHSYTWDKQNTIWQKKSPKENLNLMRWIKNIIKNLDNDDDGWMHYGMSWDTNAFCIHIPSFCTFFLCVCFILSQSCHGKQATDVVYTNNIITDTKFA